MNESEYKEMVVAIRKVMPISEFVAGLSDGTIQLHDKGFTIQISGTAEDDK